MGRIKSTPVKKLGNEIMKEQVGKFGLDFTKNKEIIKGAREIKFKKTLNLVAGFITNEVKKQEKQEKRFERKTRTRSSSSRNRDFRGRRDNYR